VHGAGGGELGGAWVGLNAERVVFVDKGRGAREERFVMGRHAELPRFVAMLVCIRRAVILVNYTCCTFVHDAPVTHRPFPKAAPGD
jgi:hypothetical protein